MCGQTDSGGGEARASVGYLVTRHALYQVVRVVAYIGGLGSLSRLPGLGRVRDNGAAVHDRDLHTVKADFDICVGDI
jgi:hypothetical protein